MTLSEDIVKKIKENHPDFNKLILDNPNTSDQDIIFLAKNIPHDSHINHILITNHKLTEKSYQTILSILQTHSHITSFNFKLIMPPNSTGAMYNAAIRKILLDNIQARKIESLEVALSNHTDTNCYKAEPRPN